MKNNIIPIRVALVALVEIALMKKQYTMHCALQEFRSCNDWRRDIHQTKIRLTAMNVNCQNISNQTKDELLYSKLVNTAVSTPHGAKNA